MEFLIISSLSLKDQFEEVSCKCIVFSAGRVDGQFWESERIKRCHSRALGSSNIGEIGPRFRLDENYPQGPEAIAISSWP